MQFSKITNYSKTPAERAIVQAAEEALSSSFLELALDWKATSTKSGLGGDALQMQLVVPFPHHCDLALFNFQPLKQAYKQKVVPTLKQGIPLQDLGIEEQKIIKELTLYKQKHPEMLMTAGTDGQRFYWEPMFVVSKSPLGLRFIIAHESGHSIYLHPNKCGSRNKRLWNSAVDYYSNWLIFRDLRARGFRNPVQLFITHLGQFATISEYASFIRDPYHPPPKMAAYGRVAGFKKAFLPGYTTIDEDILDDEIEPIYYADPNLDKEFQQPEAIYDFLWKQIPRCPCCGALAMYKKPEDFKKLEKELNVRK
jgi:hypothetical protein